MSGERIAVVDKDLCNPEKCGYVCVKFCPMNRMGKECIVEHEGKIRIEEEVCSGCGICVKKCPFQAIKIVNLLAARGFLIHQYGKNAFRLYNFPLPKRGICGFVGKNGLGKSTAISILAGKLKPNFGALEGEVDFKHLPVQIRQYLEGLKERRLAYKMQNIEQLRSFPLTVKQVLQRFVPEVWQKFAEEFDLQFILDRKLDQLSGGELQRLAIALAFAQEAEIYFFDEITNYLDINERMRMGEKVRALGESKDVVVVEHDLSILDYLSDYVYVFYGEENAYGCVSNVKQTRTGINEYLDGYLKEENVRFREEPIRFREFGECEKKEEVFFSYPAFRKTYPGFVLEAEEGEIRQGEVIGVVGRNALGKTTFVKVLAGVERDDEGRISQSGLRISYKPQYLSVEEDVFVEELFKQGQFNAEVKERAIQKMGIARVMKRRLSQLSGGELQRVAITLCLSREADLYLLDEPTAFLDVEQRLHLSSLLHQVFSKSKKAAFVVDHDILFIHAVSSRLLLFDGVSGKQGRVRAPMSKYEGMNAFLKMLDITMRADINTRRPRINKRGSAKDKEQRAEGRYYEF